MRTRALGAALAAFILHAAASSAAEIPTRRYVPRLYRSAVAREALVGHDARLLGMGSAGIALPSADAVVWNPAGLAHVRAPAVGVMDSAPSTTSRSRSSALSAAAPLTSFAIGAPGGVGAASWLDGWGDDSDKQRSFVAGYATTVGPLSAGAALRHERHYFDADSLSAWSGDVGLMATGAAGRGGSWGAGASASRLGQALVDQRGLRAPRGFSPARVGAGGWYALASGPLLVTELSYIGDALRAGRDRVRWRVGAEQLLIGGRGAIRAGYNSIANYDRISHGLTSLGASINVDGGSLDYAFVTGSDGLGSDVDSRHYLSFRMAWAGPNAKREGTPPRVQFVLPGAATPPAVSVRNGAFSPNGDGVRDTFSLDVGSSEPDARLAILTRSGDTVASAPVSDRMVASWGGLASDGSAAPDGLYRWELVARDRVIRSGVVRRDATPPALAVSPTVVAVLPGDVDPFGAVTLAVVEDSAIEAWSFAVSTEGKLAHEIQGTGPLPGELRVAEIDHLNPGRPYSVALSVTDEAGNESVASATFAVLDLRRHVAWERDGDVLIDAPSTYFDAAGPELSRHGRDLVAAISRDPGLYVAVAEASDDLSTARATSVAGALVEEGLPPDHVGLGPPVNWSSAESPAVRLVVSRQPSSPGLGATAEAIQTRAPRGYRVLVGSFRERVNAEEAAATFKDAGFAPSVQDVSLPSGRWYRVTLGSFEERHEAEALRERVRPHVADEPVILPPAGR